MANGYCIYYRQYNDNTLLKDYNRVLCFSDVFCNGIKKETTRIILYIPQEDLKIELELFKKWVQAVNDAGFPAKYMGLSTDEGLEFLDLENIPYYIVELPATEYKNIVHLSAGLTYIRYAYDYSGHCGKKPHTICLNYFKIKKMYNVDNLSAIIGASNIYGEGGHHITHNKANLNLYTLEEYIKKCTVKSLYKKHDLGLWATSNKFATGKRYKTIEELAELFGNKKEEKPKLKVYVVGPEKNYANWLPNSIVVPTLKQSDLVLFTGGEDVNPKYYGEPKHPRTYINTGRDKYEKLIFTLAKKQNKKILGICRGSQFVCVMSGGRLVQDQSNPHRNHEINSDKYGTFVISSTHHQAQFPFNMKKWDYNVIAWTQGISDHHQDGYKQELNPEKECEIVHYKNTNALGIQGHPEFADYQKSHPEDLKKVQQLFTDFIEDKL